MPLWDFDHPDSTEVRFRRILPTARASGDTDYLAQLLTQIARTQGLQRQFDSAHRTLDEAEKLLRKDSPKAEVRCLLERGRVYNSSGDKNAARPLFDAAWNEARRSGLDPLAVDAAHMIAIVSPPDSAIAWNERAIAYAEGAKDPKARDWLGSLYNNLGWTYHDKGEYPKALDLFEKALAWRQERGNGAEARIARWCVARCLRSLGRIDEALAAQLKLQSEIAAAGAEEDGYVSEEIGECLLSLGRETEAKPHFAKAYALLSRDPDMQANEVARLARLKRLGGVEGE